MSPAERPGAKYRLEQIQAWMASQSCRRIGLIEYFGQKHAKDDCGMCDRCVETKPT